MSELVDPLALDGAPPRPGVVVVPDPAPAPDPLESLHFADLPAGGGSWRCEGCGREVLPPERMFKLPSGWWRCARCARAALDR